MMSKPDVRIELVLVTKEIAEELLGVNRENRRVQSSRVARYARDMEQGKWRFTGAPVTLSDEELMDGQHRLLAIVKSGISQWMVVIYGIDEAAWHNYDENMVRTLNHKLARAGVVNVGSVAALTRMIWVYERGYAFNTSQTTSAGSGASPSTDELVEVYEMYANRIQQAVREGRRHASRLKGMPPVNYTFAYYLFRDIDCEANELFWISLVDGEGLSSTSSIYHLRNSIIRWSQVRDKPSAGVQLALVFKAWNSWIQGKEMGCLKYSPATETFPEPAGALN